MCLVYFGDYIRRISNPPFYEDCNVNPLCLELKYFRRFFIIFCLFVFCYINRCPGFVCSSDQSWAVTTFYPFRAFAGYLKLRTR